MNGQKDRQIISDEEMDSLRDMLHQGTGYIRKEDLMALSQWAFIIRANYALLLLVLERKLFVSMDENEEPRFSKVPCPAVAQNLN